MPRQQIRRADERDEDGDDSSFGTDDSDPRAHSNTTADDAPNYDDDDDDDDDDIDQRYLETIVVEAYDGVSLALDLARVEEPDAVTSLELAKFALATTRKKILKTSDRSVPIVHPIELQLEKKREIMLEHLSKTKGFDAPLMAEDADIVDPLFYNVFHTSFLLLLRLATLWNPHRATRFEKSL